MPFVRLKRRVQDGVKVWHFEASLILQVVLWCLRYPVSYP
jgi:transposase-like protein